MCKLEVWYVKYINAKLKHFVCFLCVLPRCESIPIVGALESGDPGQQPTLPNATFGTGSSQTSFELMFYGI